MYLRRNGWTTEDSFAVRTAAGEIRPRIDGELCTLDIGRVRLRAEGDYPAGSEDGTGTLSSDGREFAFQFVQVGNPQVSIEVADGLEELDLQRYGPGHRAQRAVPEPHERLLLAPHRRRGHPRPHLRARGGGDAGLRDRRHRRRRRGDAARSREPRSPSRSTAASSWSRWART